MVMDTILVVNAGSSSLKFQVFAAGPGGDLDCLIKGQMDGIGTRPRLRATGADKATLIDQNYPPDKVPDLPAATQETGDWLREHRRRSTSLPSAIASFTAVPSIAAPCA